MSWAGGWAAVCRDPGAGIPQAERTTVFPYGYISFLLMLPFLRKIAKDMDFQGFVWLIVSAEIMQLVMALDYFLFRGQNNHTSHFYFFTSASYVLYPLCGYYLEHKLSRDKPNAETTLIFAVIALLTISFTCILTDWRRDMDGGWNSGNEQTYLSTFTVFPAMFIYVFFKSFLTKHQAPAFLKKILFVISSCTFGVYLFESTCRYQTKFIYLAIEKTVGVYPGCWIHALCAAALGIAATFLFKCLTGLLRHLIDRLIGRQKAVPPAPAAPEPAGQAKGDDG